MLNVIVNRNRFIYTQTFVLGSLILNIILNLNKNTIMNIESLNEESYFEDYDFIDENELPDDILPMMFEDDELMDANWPDSEE